MRDLASVPTVIGSVFHSVGELVRGAFTSQTNGCSPVRGWRGLAGLLILTGALFASEASRASDYRLGAQDKVRLIVFEWRPQRGEAYSWTPLNAEFIVSSSGMLSLPLVGDVKAEALTAEELGNAISAQLQRKMDLLERPSTSVQITQFRPFYITGEVANPGEFPFRPGLTVMKALSIAGGVYRPSGISAAGLVRDATLARGDLRVLRAERVALLARRARLTAEAADKAKIEFPDELTRPRADLAVADIMREEQSIFELRRNSVLSKVENLKQAKTLLEREIAALTAKGVNVERQLALAVTERENVKSLAGKGLVVSNRQLSTEQVVAQMESSRLDIGIARVRAEQDKSKIDRDIIDTQDQRRAEIFQELRLTNNKLQEGRERLTTSERLAFTAEVVGPAQEAKEARDRLVVPSFVIFRARSDKAEQISADGDARIEPGDIIQVMRPSSESLPGGTATMDRTGRLTALSRVEP